MNPVRLSRFLSLVLRHDPAAAGVALDDEGWVAIDALLAGVGRAGLSVTRAELLELVETSDKRRFAVDVSHDRIRANQGHSVPVDLGLAPVAPPPRLYHGTVARAVPTILREGLRPMARHHVHLSADVPTALRVGGRRGRPAVLRVDADGMDHAGHTFFRSANDVWLTAFVPAEYLARLAPGIEGC